MEGDDELSHPWLAPGRGRALRACSRAQRDALLVALRAGLSEWSRAWGLDAQAWALACSDFSAVPDGAWHELRNDAGAVVAWLQGPAEPALLLQHLFAGARTVGVLGQASCERCVADATTRMAAALGLQWDQPGKGSAPAAEAGRWTGALQIDITLPAMDERRQLDWRLVLSGEAAAAWCSRTGHLRRQRMARARQAPVSAAQALANRRITLQVRLDGCELDLGALRALAPGDIVRLRHVITAPAMLADGRGRSCLTGYLVRQAGHRALELARAEDPPMRRPT